MQIEPELDMIVVPATPAALELCALLAKVAVEYDKCETEPRGSRSADTS